MPPLPLIAKFFRTELATVPVRDWLRNLPRDDCKTIGEDIRTVQIGWPLGMPLGRKLDSELWEVRINLTNNIARVLFTMQGDTMILLHGFIKKSQKTPTTELAVAKNRLKLIKGNL